MSRRYRARKNRRERWYNVTASIWAWAREAERGYEVPPRPTEDEYHLLPVLDLNRFKEDEWYAKQAQA